MGICALGHFILKFASENGIQNTSIPTILASLKKDRIKVMQISQTNEQCQNNQGSKQENICEEMVVCLIEGSESEKSEQDDTVIVDQCDTESFAHQGLAENREHIEPKETSVKHTTAAKEEKEDSKSNDKDKIEEILIESEGENEALGSLTNYNGDLFVTKNEEKENLREMESKKETIQSVLVNAHGESESVKSLEINYNSDIQEIDYPRNLLNKAKYENDTSFQVQKQENTSIEHNLQESASVENNLQKSSNFRQINSQNCDENLEIGQYHFEQDLQNEQHEYPHRKLQGVNSDGNFADNSDNSDNSDIEDDSDSDNQNNFFAEVKCHSYEGEMHNKRQCVRIEQSDSEDIVYLHRKDGISTPSTNLCKDISFGITGITEKVYVNIQNDEHVFCGSASDSSCSKRSRKYDEDWEISHEFGRKAQMVHTLSENIAYSTRWKKHKISLFDCSASEIESGESNINEDPHTGTSFAPIEIRSSEDEALRAQANGQIDENIGLNENMHDPNTTDLKLKVPLNSFNFKSKSLYVQKLWRKQLKANNPWKPGPIVYCKGLGYGVLSMYVS